MFLCEVERCFIDALGFWKYSISDRYYLDASGEILNQPVASSLTFSAVYESSEPGASIAETEDNTGSEEKTEKSEKMVADEAAG